MKAPVSTWLSPTSRGEKGGDRNRSERSIEPGQEDPGNADVSLARRCAFDSQRMGCIAD